jgi:hypothetical protein
MKQAANGTWSKDLTMKRVTLPPHINTIGIGLRCRSSTPAA